MDSSFDAVLTANRSAASAGGESIEGQIALGLRKLPRSVADFEPLLTADEVANGRLHPRRAARLDEEAGRQGTSARPNDGFGAGELAR
jgi:hypothetical protein